MSLNMQEHYDLSVQIYLKFIRLRAADSHVSPQFSNQLSNHTLPRSYQMQSK